MSQHRSNVDSKVEEICHTRLKPLLERSKSDPRPVVLMMCGCAGAGKSTYSKTIAKLLPSFQRISIDGILATRYGLYGIDYPRSKHEEYAEEADRIFHQTTIDLLTQESPPDVILDRAFYAKDDRDAYRALVEKRGGRVVLVYLSAPREVLWGRIRARRDAGIDADSALEISEELLNNFYDGFEVPRGEGEVVVQTADMED